MRMKAVCASSPSSRLRCAITAVHSGNARTGRVSCSRAGRHSLSCEAARLGLYRLPIGEFPILRNLASDLARYDGAAELEHGLEILLSGLSAAP